MIRTIYQDPRFRVSSNFDHYVSIKNKDGTLGFKLIRKY